MARVTVTSTGSGSGAVTSVAGKTGVVTLDTTDLATNPLARANHTGTQAMATISDAGALATKSAVASADITDGTIVGGDLSSTIAIPSAATATTQAVGDKSTKLATTAYADGAFGNPGPKDHGYSFWTFDPAALSSNVQLTTSGVWMLTRVKTPYSKAITAVDYFIDTSGGGLTAAQNFVAVFESDGTLLGSSDQSSNFAAAQGKKQASISCTVGTNSFVWVGFVANGTTMPKFSRWNSYLVAATNANLAVSASRAGTVGSGVTAAAAITPGSITQIAQHIWAALN